MSRTEDDGLDRRTVLKTGALLGAAAVLTSKKSLVFAQSAPPPLAQPVLCGTVAPVSPPTRPFIDALPVPLPALPQILNPLPTKAANTGAGEAARDAHQRWEQFLPLLMYRMTAAPSLHQHHTDLLPSFMWTFNSTYPAPTPLNYYGVPTIVRFVNNLPTTPPNTTFGINEITVHLHNGHTARETASPATSSPPFLRTTTTRTRTPGSTTSAASAMRARRCTFWFHDHRAAFTANN
jgi:hypothetical protein